MPAWEINSPAFISSVCLTAGAELEMARGVGSEAGGGDEDHTSHRGIPASLTWLCLCFVSVHLLMCIC